MEKERVEGEEELVEELYSNKGLFLVFNTPISKM